MTRPRVSIPSPLDVVRVLPRLGLRLLFPAMVFGAFFGSLLDMLLRHDGYPLAMVGVVIGPVVFAFAINAVERLDRAHADRMNALAEDYRRAETEKRKRAAEDRGELVRIEDHRPRRR